MESESESDEGWGKRRTTSGARQEEYKPGSFLKRLLLADREKATGMDETAEKDVDKRGDQNSDSRRDIEVDVGNGFKMQRGNQSRSRQRSRSRHRSRSRKSKTGKRMLRSVSPLPKKMPRPFPKPLPKAFPKPCSDAPKPAVVCPDPKSFLKPKASSKAVSLKPSSKASAVAGKTPRVALVPNLSSSSLPSNHVYARARPSSAPKHPGTLNSPKIHVETEGQAMKILARHSARLGPLGTKLETAVREMAVGDFSEQWDFLVCENGMARYRDLRQRFTEIYNRSRLCVDADREVLSQLRDGESSPSTSAKTPAVPPPSKHAAPGQTLRLPVVDVRFAHNDQSERFGNSGNYKDSSSGSILQLTAELLAGLTDPESVPTFSVCWFEGHWYCRTGNRRLAAFRLAHLLAPRRFREIDVWVVETDTVFVRGAPGRRPKLTTNLNGDRCLGRWLIIRETGEVVGHGKPDHTQYGVDLLALLPLVYH